MTAKSDAEKLMNTMLPLAERMLSEHGEFYPYGGYMKPDGEIVHLGAEDEDTEHPKAQDLLYVLRSSLSEIARARGCRATAIIFDARIDVPNRKGKTDAIQICVEHAEGYVAEIFLPYEIAKNGDVTYGSMFAQPGKRELFVT